MYICIYPIKSPKPMVKKNNHCKTPWGMTIKPFGASQCWKVPAMHLSVKNLVDDCQRFQKYIYNFKKYKKNI